MEQYDHCSMTDNNNSLWDRLQREKNMQLQPTAMFGIFIGTNRCHRTGPARWPFPHISHRYHGELFPVSTRRTSCHFITRRFTYFYRTRTNGGFPRIYTDLSYGLHSAFLRLALSGKFLPTFVSARGTRH